MVTVQYGPSSQGIATGRSVAELRNIFASAFGIPAGAVASLNATQVFDENTVPGDGSKLVFSLGVGEKG